MEYYKLSPASFAEQIGINRSNLTHLFSGRNQPSLDLAKKILHCYPDIKTEWLIMGVGDMFRNNEEKELNIRVENEKKNTIFQPVPELFTEEILQSHVVSEASVANLNKIDVPIFDSKSDITGKEVTLIHKQPVGNTHLPSHSTLPTISKIIFFYSNNSFEIFHPNQ